MRVYRKATISTTTTVHKTMTAACQKSAPDKTSVPMSAGKSVAVWFSIVESFGGIVGIGVDWVGVGVWDSIPAEGEIITEPSFTEKVWVALQPLVVPLNILTSLQGPWTPIDSSNSLS